MVKKYKNILLIIYVITLFAACVGATLAYFTAIKSSTVSPSTKVQSATMSSAAFISGEPIYIYANLENFGIGMGDLKDSSYATASLKAADNNEIVAYYYNVSLNIEENTFEYSSLDNDPEILIKITNPYGNEVKSINGLNYVDGKGFDVTDKIGEFKVADHFEISTNGFVEQFWNLEVTLVNLDTTQNVNMGHNIIGAITLDPIV